MLVRIFLLTLLFNARFNEFGHVGNVLIIFIYVSGCIYHYFNVVQRLRVVLHHSPTVRKNFDP